MRSRLLGWGSLLLALAGCGDGTGPATATYVIEAVGAVEQIGEVGQSLPEPFEARVTDAGEPVEGVSVSWEIVAGDGAVLSPASSSTDADGIARTTLQLGPDVGTYEVHASIDGVDAAPAKFTARAVERPVIASVTPSEAAVGDLVTIAGERFSPNVADNVVLFDGFRGLVVEATDTQLRVVVPSCLPTRTVDVTVRIGPVESEPFSALDVTGDDTPPIDLAVGEALALSDPEALSCVRLPGGENGIAFLAVQQNASGVAGQSLPYQVVGLTGPTVGVTAALAPRPTVTALPLQRAGFRTAQAAFETRVRLRERALARYGAAPETRELAPAMAKVPAVGDRREFEVYSGVDEFTTITAEVKYVSTNAVLYQDVDAPAGGFTAADFASFAALFDAPIFTADTATFGAPSDIDGNGRIIILFTPVVNELTPPGLDGGFIAGFFYGIDLFPKDVYAHSNEAEIFYSVVPDPDGVHGDAHSRDQVLRTVPPVLAHELQHMIHFAHRKRLNAPQDELWISEGLAHMAEDVVAAELERRGDIEQAENFRLDNYERAYRFLDLPDATSIIDAEDMGTLAERGAQWLFIKYLAGHYGGSALLRALTQTALSGVANVENATGAAWADLFEGWSVALWADDAPELAGVAIDPAYTFPDIDLRREISSRDGYPLVPVAVGYQDFELTGTLKASSPMYAIIEAPGPLAGSPPALHLSFSRAGGGAFLAGDRPRWTLLRIR
ncbi:MAG TPA: IPT/TIG domain-containing protein [Longimicrobiales bacterium]